MLQNFALAGQDTELQCHVLNGRQNCRKQRGQRCWRVLGRWSADSGGAGQPLRTVLMRMLEGPTVTRPLFRRPSISPSKLLLRVFVVSAAVLQPVQLAPGTEYKLQSST